MPTAEIEIPEKIQLLDKNAENIYRVSFPGVARFVRKMNGSPADAMDIFHDALLIYLQKVRQQPELVKSVPENYILGIAKHLWIRQFNHDRKQVHFSNDERELTIPEEYFPSISTSRLMNFLEKSGKKCLDLLHAFYFERQGIGMLKQSLQYQNAHAASVQKYKCIEKLRIRMKEQKITYEDFTD